MSSKKRSAPAPLILQHIEGLDPDFADAIRTLCMAGSLVPGSNSYGVTFLFPEDPKVREEIVVKSTESPDEATKILESLIIPDALGSGEDWLRKKVGSAGGVLFAVASAGGSSATLAGAGGGSLTATRDDGFRGGRESGVSVWRLAGGRPPVAGAAYARPVRRAEEKRLAQKTPAAQAEAQARARFAMATEAAFDEAMRRGHGAQRNPYLAKVAGLLGHLRRAQPELFRAVAGVLDWSPEVSFYLLVEPYKSRGEFLIPDAVLAGPGGWNFTDGFGDVVAEFKAAIGASVGAAPAGGAAGGKAAPPDKHAGGANGRGRERGDGLGIPAGGRADSKRAAAGARPAEPRAALERQRDIGAVVSKIDEVRQRIVEAPNARKTPKDVCDAYKILASQNKIGDMAGALPAATARLLPGMKKLWQDELRGVLHAALRELRGRPYDTAQFAEIVEMLRVERPGNDYAAEATFAAGEDFLKGNVAPNAEFGALMKFVNSTDFLYVPIPEALVGDEAGDPVDPTDFQVYNRNAEALRALAAVRIPVRDALSRQTVAELQAFARQFGRLPAEVTALGEAGRKAGDGGGAGAVTDAPAPSGAPASGAAPGSTKG